MSTILTWIYILNTTLLIVHEMDSVHWKEWDLFGLPGGVKGFLWLHIPIYIFGLYGLVEVSRPSPIGLLIAVIVGLAGIFAFSIHTYFLLKGRPEFDTRFSKGVLLGILVLSVLQIASAVFIFVVLLQYWL